jgi:hypothetical protein
MLTLPEIMQHHHNLFGVRTANDIRAMKERLREPILGQDMPTFIDFCSKFQNTIGRLLRARQEVSSFDQMDLFAQATASQPQIVRGIEIYVEGTPLLANRTLNNLILAVRVYLTNVVASPGGFAAAASVSPSIKYTQADLDRAVAHALGKSKSKTKRPYCYVHGYTGHEGKICKKMLADPQSFSPAMLAAKDPNAVAGGHP